MVRLAGGVGTAVRAKDTYVTCGVNPDSPGLLNGGVSVALGKTVGVDELNASVDLPATPAVTTGVEEIAVGTSPVETVSSRNEAVGLGAHAGVAQ